jgi:hypothetical protein
MSREKFQQSIPELLSGLQDLDKSLVALRERIRAECGLEYGRGAQQLALDGMQQYVGACYNWISLLYSAISLCVVSPWEQVPTLASFEQKFLKILGSELDLEKTIRHMEQHLRHGLMLMVHFLIDNLFQNILMALRSDEKNSLGNFAQKANNVLTKTLHEDEREAATRILTALAYMRNSFHNNGIHRRGSDLTFQLKGEDFIFERNKLVRCAGWKHVIALISGTIEILQKVFLSEAMKGLDIEDKGVLLRKNSEIGNLVNS